MPNETKAIAQSAVEAFVQNYIMAESVDLGSGMISWPYRFEWVTNWGIKLTPPWYSPYVNSQVVSLAALLYRLTGKEEYRTLALAAARYVVTPISKGGAQYSIDGFRFPAEYVYPTPPIPNIRVIDGEFGSAIALYNGARLLGDSELLRQSSAYFASLGMALEGYLKQDGTLWFSYYGENMPDGYGWPIFALLQNAGIIMKDQRFTEYARKMRPSIGENWCNQLGC
jgi:hypothetical protein